MKQLAFFFICLLSNPIEATPWGKDADLVEQTKTIKHTPASKIAEWGITAIRFHQEIISPADGPRSHFIPSSSQYTLEAIQKYGFFRGYLMGCDRLMRENSDPWVYRQTRNIEGCLMKWDPVPVID